MSVFNPKLKFSSGRSAMVLGTLLLLSSCNPLNELYKEIRRYGYIEYKTPLEHAGTGTIIGGSPRSFSILAPPQECFPDVNEQGETELRNMDNTSLPSKARAVNVNADVSLGLLKLAQLNDGTIELGAGFSHVSKVSMEMSDATVEYFNAPKLTRFYNDNMDDVCKEFLDIGGFIFQALRVGKLKYTFYNKNGGKIELSLGNISQYLDISAKLNFSIENSSSLVFTGPRFIGFQLGRLRKEDQGIGLYRATKTKNNKWVWEALNIFQTHSHLPAALQPARETVAQGHDNIDQFSLFR